MSKFSKLFSIIIAVSMIVCALCINAMAVDTYVTDDFTIGGVCVKLDGYLDVNSLNAYGLTEVTYQSGSSATINLYAVLMIEYSDGSDDHDTGSLTNTTISSSYSQKYKYIYATKAIDSSKTLDWVACNHDIVNANNTSNNGTVNTSLYDFDSLRTLYFPGIDF